MFLKLLGFGTSISFCRYPVKGTYFHIHLNSSHHINHFLDHL